MVSRLVRVRLRHGRWARDCLESRSRAPALPLPFIVSSGQSWRTRRRAPSFLTWLRAHLACDNSHGDTALLIEMR